MSAVILALDTSGSVASVALMRRTDSLVRLTGGFRLQSGFTHSETLMPMLEKMTELASFDLNEVDAIAVTSGPGSFTGLRIGASAAKGLAFALKKPLIAVPTLEAIAYNLTGVTGIVCPMLDARRGQVYTAAYHVAGELMAPGDASAGRDVTAGMQSAPVCVIAPCAVAVEEIIAQLNAQGETVHLTGDGVPVYREQIRERLQVPYRIVPAHQDRQNAESVAALAFVYYDAGRITDAASFAPEYIRLSQAERQRQDADTRSV